MLANFADKAGCFMTDIWDKAKRSQVMARIKSRDTKPELVVRRYLYAHGYRYRKNVKTLPGTPDIVMHKYGVVIFVHGCFWHGHEADSHLPKSNHEFWKAKIERNRERDRQVKERLKAMGWRVMTIWECQLRPAVRERTLREMEYLINHSYLDRLRAKAGKRTYDFGEEGESLQAAEDSAGYGTASPLSVDED